MRTPSARGFRAAFRRSGTGTFGIILSIFLTACDRSSRAPEAKIREAISRYEQARQQVLDVYDAEITAAQRPGGAGLNSAKQLAEEKVKFLERIDARHAVSGFHRDEVVALVSGKTWYWHWEQLNRDRPFKINIVESGDVVPGTAAKNWKLELRWILTDGSTLLVPIEDYALRGFFIPSGRQVGAFADKPK